MSLGVLFYIHNLSTLPKILLLLARAKMNFYQDIKEIDRKDQERWIVNLIGDYYYMLLLLFS